MSVDFGTPETYERLEAAGALYAATYRLAKAYNVQPMKLIEKIKQEAQYSIEDLIQAGATDDEAADQAAKASDNDQPINLDDIPF